MGGGGSRGIASGVTQATPQGYGGYWPARFTGTGFSGESAGDPIPAQLQNYDKLFGWPSKSTGGGGGWSSPKPAPAQQQSPWALGGGLRFPLRSALWR